MNLRLPDGVNSVAANWALVPFIQTGDKRQDIKVNVERFRGIFRSLFMENDLSDAKVVTNMSKDALEFLMGDNSAVVDRAVCSTSLCDVLDTDEKCILIDEQAEVAARTIKNSMHMISLQIPYELDWDENNLKYHPNDLSPTQLTYYLGSRNP